MQTIWKFELPMDDYFNIQMPKDAKILCVQAQYEKPYLWALVNSNAEKETRYFRMSGTGHLISEKFGENMIYIGTFQLVSGQFVGHIFELNT
jgi:hypothetical protein|tara:strand:+ start:14706 stop:14981 length:276 start_codon:yes stop_codon:yes gene_type:complete